MASSTEIANLALAHLGTGKQIASLTERSAEAAACKKFFETARKATLRDFKWPIATKIAALGLVTEDGDTGHPTDEYQYSYRLPSDCLFARRILSGTRNDTTSTRIHYRLIHDAAGPLILTDKEDAELEYTVNHDDYEHYTPDMIMALSYRLAAYIAPLVSKGDVFKLRTEALKMYQFEISTAQAAAFNEEAAEEAPDSEFIRARNG